MNINELKNDNDFMNRLADADSVETVKELLLEKDIVMSDDDIANAMASADDEFDEKALESVSGGGMGIGLGLVALAFLIGAARSAKKKGCW